MHGYENTQPARLACSEEQCVHISCRGEVKRGCHLAGAKSREWHLHHTSSLSLSRSLSLTHAMLDEPRMPFSLGISLSPRKKRGCISLIKQHSRGVCVIGQGSISYEQGHMRGEHFLLARCPWTHTKHAYFRGTSLMRKSRAPLGPP